jgi:hypothetical protein
MNATEGSRFSNPDRGLLDLITQILGIVTEVFQKHAGSGEEGGETVDEGQHAHLSEETEPVKTADRPLNLRLVSG